MAVELGRSGIYTSIEDESVDSIRLMWWKQYVYPMLYYSADDFLGIPEYEGTVIARAEAGYDYAEVWRSNTADVGLIIPPRPADPNGGPYYTNYLDPFLDRDPEIPSDAALARGEIRGFLTREQFIEMSEEEARGVIQRITRRMNYVVEFWIGQLERGRIDYRLWYDDSGTGRTYLYVPRGEEGAPLRAEGSWRGFSERVRTAGAFDTYNLKKAIKDAKLWKRFFGYNPERDRNIYPDGDPSLPRANTIEFACADLLPGSMIPRGLCLLASRDSGAGRGTDGRYDFDLEDLGEGTTRTPSGTIPAEELDPPREPSVPAEIVPAPPPCPEDEEDAPTIPDECAFDPNAIIPEWTATDLPFLNPRVCEYYVPIETDYTCPGGEELPSRIEEFLPEAVEILMDFLSKEYDATDELTLKEFIIEARSYEFDKAPNVNVKFLYKFPFSLIKALRLEDIVPATPDEVQTPGGSFEFETKNLEESLDRISNFVSALSRQQLELWRERKTKILIDGSVTEIDLAAEANNLLVLKSAIERVLANNKYTLPTEAQPRTVGTEVDFPNAQQVASDILIYHDSEYKISSMFARELGGDYKELSIQSVGRTSPLSFSSMIGYLSRIKDIMIDIESAEAPSVLDFAQTYHIPTVRIADQAVVENQSYLPASCQGGEFSAITNSILDSVTNIGDEFASRFTSGLCLTQEEIAERDRLLQNSITEISDVLSAENLRQIGINDPLISNLARSVENLREGFSPGGSVRAAWESLFNRMSACGLFNVMTKTIEFISQNDVCGISPTTALQIAIKASLKKLNTDVLQRIYSSLSSEQQSDIEQRYIDRLTQYADETGFNGGIEFPWDFEEQQRSLENDEYAGNFVYGGTVFSPEEQQQVLNDYRAAYVLGYRGTTPVPPEEYTEEQKEVFWRGFVVGWEDEASTGRIPDPTVPPREQLLDELGRLEENRPGVNSSQFGQLTGGLFADLIDISIDILVDQIMDVTPVDEIVEKTRGVPVVGTLIQGFLDSGKCVINLNARAGDRIVNLNTIQENVTEAVAQFDICDITRGFRALTLPDVEVILENTFNVNTLRSAFVNALIPVLRELLVKIIVESLVRLLSKATQVLQGAVCEKVRGNISASIEAGIEGSMIEPDVRVGNLGELFREAYCGPDTTQGEIDAELARLFASTSGRQQVAAAATSSDTESCSLVEALAGRLRMDQLLDLLEGTASEGTVDVILQIARTECVEFSSILTDSESVVSFFRTLGLNFAPEFLGEFRASLGAFGVGRENIASTCDEMVENPLADILRRECGDQITEEQIQEQVDLFNQKVGDIVSDFAATMAAGFDGSLETAVRQTLKKSIPKDSPENLSLVEEVVGAMLDQFYSVYAADIANGATPNNTNGLMNAVLSNKNAVPLRRQFSNYQAAIAFFGGPAADFLPLATRPDATQVAEAIAKSFFGDEEVSIDAVTTGDDGSESRSRSAIPPVPTKKPQTISRYLQELLRSGEYVETDSTNPEKIVMTFNVETDRFQIGKIFDISYNFNTARFVLKQYYPSTDGSAVDESQTIEFIGQSSEEVLATLQRTVYGPNPTGYNLINLHRDYGGRRATETEQLNIGNALILRQFIINGLVPAPDTSRDFVEELLNITKAMRNNIVRSVSDSVANNQNAFDYGRYNLDRIYDSQLYPEVSTDLVEQGYNVVYLEDGSIFVQPPRKGGWLELKDILLPEINEAYCCPDKRELFDLESIKIRTVEGYKLTEDDPRLGLNPREVRQPPYSRPLSRLTLASIEGVVLTTLRAYIVEHIVLGYASFSNFKTNTNGVYDDTLVEYLAEKIKAGLKAQPPNPGGPAVPEGTIEEDETRSYAYWYEFLEQCIQAYIRRSNAGTAFIDQEIDAALRSISVAMEQYVYPQRSSLRAARQTRPFITLKRLRRETKIQAIQQTEQFAMVILKQLIAEELDKISDDIEDIFPTPTNGWVENVSLEFLRSGVFSIEGSNIFDAPRVDGRILPGVSLELFASEFEANSQFVLESYVKAELSDLGRSAISGFPTGAVLGLQEIREILESSADYDEISSRRINEVFSNFRYGLRLVYVPRPDEFGGDVVKSQMFEDLVNRLFKHGRGIAAGGVGLYTIPVVYSQDLELSYTGTVADFVATALEPQSTLENTGFNWRMLSLLMTQNEEFRVMFEYASPLKTIVSLVSAYNVEAFLDSVGPSDEWNVGSPPSVRPGTPGILPPPSSYFSWNRKVFPRLKRRLKRLFNRLYNSNDYTYQPAGASSAREQITNAREDLSLATWREGLTPTFRTRVIFEDPLCLRADSPLAEAPRGSIPGYEGTVADRAAELAEEGLSATEIKDQLELEAGYGSRNPDVWEEAPDSEPEMPDRSDFAVFNPDEEDEADSE